MARAHVTSGRTIERLSVYRRLLCQSAANGDVRINSRELASLAGNNPAQVRRDIMELAYSGQPAPGYEISRLVRSIDDFLHSAGVQKIVIVGMGNLGKALFRHFMEKHPRFPVVAVFDRDCAKVGRVMRQCWCHHMASLPGVVRETGAQIGVICVPGAEAPAVASRLVRAAVRGLLDFSGARYRVPRGVFVEHVNLATALEKLTCLLGRSDGRRTMGGLDRERKTPCFS